MKEYPISPATSKQIDQAFCLAPATIRTDDQRERAMILVERLHSLTTEIAKLTPPGREQSLALTKAEELMYFAVSAIAREAP